MAVGPAPPGPAVTYVSDSVTNLYMACQLIPNAPGNLAAIKGAIQTLQSLLTDWYVNGES